MPRHTGINQSAISAEAGEGTPLCDCCSVRRCCPPETIADLMAPAQQHTKSVSTNSSARWGPVCGAPAGRGRSTGTIGGSVHLASRRGLFRLCDRVSRNSVAQPPLAIVLYSHASAKSMQVIGPSSNTRCPASQQAGRVLLLREAGSRWIMSSNFCHSSPSRTVRGPGDASYRRRLTENELWGGEI
jgi:hypothetical protein